MRGGSSNCCSSAPAVARCRWRARATRSVYRRDNSSATAARAANSSSSRGEGCPPRGTPRSLDAATTAGRRFPDRARRMSARALPDGRPESRIPPSAESAPPPASRSRRPVVATPHLRDRPRTARRAKSANRSATATIPSGRRSIGKPSNSSVVGVWKESLRGTVRGGGGFDCLSSRVRERHQSALKSANTSIIHLSVPAHGLLKLRTCA